MTVVRIHYDGWLALPSVQRRRLGLKTGDMLEVVPTGDGILLRRKAAPSQASEKAPPQPEMTLVADEAGQAPAAEAGAREMRGGRRRRAAAALPRALKARGKRPGTRTNAATPGQG